MGVSSQLHASVSLSPGKDLPAPSGQEVGWLNHVNRIEDI